MAALDGGGAHTAAIGSTAHQPLWPHHRRTQATAAPIPDSVGTICGTLGAHSSTRDGAHNSRSSSTRDSRFFLTLSGSRGLAPGE